MFRHEEDQVGAAPVALLGDGLWKSKFASAPDVIGKSLTLNDTAYTVIGVVTGRTPMFDPVVMDVYVPIGQWADPTFRDRKLGMGTQGLGKLESGVTFQQAGADMDSVARNLAVTYPDADKGTSITLNPLKKDIVGDIQPALFILLGAVGFVLLIACANVANLLLARSAGRAREFAIRAAMGASQFRVIRQLLTESVLLGVAGGALGLLLANWGTSAVLAALPAALPRADHIHLDAGVLLFTLGISVLAGAIFGLAPALRTARPDVAGTLKEGGRGGSGARHRTQNVFVVIEMALSLVLLIGAGLMIRTLAALGKVDPGFNQRNVLTFSLGLSPAKMSTAAKIRGALRDATASFASIPGVEAASAFGGSIPMQGDSELPFWREGQPRPATDGEMNFALWYPVQPQYLQVMGTPLVRGRFISAQDTENAPLVIVIDQSFAREYFPNEDPVGKRINIGLLNGMAEIVGVVGHVKHWGLGDKGHQNLQAEFYTSIVQLPDQVLPLAAGGIGMVVRTSGNPDAFTSAIRQASTKFDSGQLVYDFTAMTKIVSDSIATQRFTMILLGIFSGLALVLSSVGIYGVISYVVGQRTHEIGIRMALGAQRPTLTAMFVRQGLRLTLIGAACGLVTAFVTMRLMSSLLFNVSPVDPITYVTITFGVVAVAWLACYLPSRRAATVEPMKALRSE
jgi:predicted permease